MMKRFALHGLTILGLAFAVNAGAQESSGAYVGAAIGEASVKVDEVDFDESDTSFKVFGGYAFNQYVAVEAQYISAGKPSQDFGGGSVEVELTGLAGSVVAGLPIGDAFRIFGKLGFVTYDGEVRGVVNGETVIEEDGSDEDVLYGVGGELMFGSFGLRAEYEVVDAADAEFDILSIGGLYRF